MISQVYNMDCLQGMKQFEDNYFDLAIVDPPYGISAPNMQMGNAPTRKGKGQYAGVSTAVKVKRELSSGRGKLKNRILNTSNCDWDKHPPTVEYFNELFRVSKNQIVWGGNYFPQLWKNSSRGIVVWDKMQPWENFSQFEMAWTSFDRPARLYKLSSRGGDNAEKKIHPTQKPVKIYRMILNDFAYPATRYSTRTWAAKAAVLQLGIWGLIIGAMSWMQCISIRETSGLKNSEHSKNYLYDSRIFTTI